MRCNDITWMVFVELAMSSDSPLILTIESTCDETAAAIVTSGPRVLASVVASQAALHERFRGVVPEVAARAHVERMLPVIDEALKKAGISPRQLDAVAVANEPGLGGSLVVGLIAAKSLALVLGKPLISINHLHAHIYACQFGEAESIFPCVGLVASGGHSHLYRCESPLKISLLGGTIDDAAGEAFDKVGGMLGLPFPGGPAISRAAQNGNPKAFAFPRSFLNEPDRLEFSFSGLKTAVRYTIAGITGEGPESNRTLDEQTVADIAASFQAAVVDCLVDKSFQALRVTGYRNVAVGGGVAANRLFRSQLQAKGTGKGIRLLISPMEMCTDNAAMGAIALEKYSAGEFESLDLDIRAGLVR
jgi:N6-L-threonylcarbamoyladenine synthase